MLTVVGPRSLPDLDHGSLDASELNAISARKILSIQECSREDSISLIDALIALR
jgi:hypothetical protein